MKIWNLSQSWRAQYIGIHLVVMIFPTSEVCRAWVDPYILYEENILPVDPSGISSSLWLFHPPWPAEASFCIVQYPLTWEIDGQFLDRHLDLLRVLVIDLDQGWMGSSWLSCGHTAGKFNFCALEACAQLGVLVIILLLLRKTVAPAFEL